MYRYSLDQHIVYNSEDLVLFRESPFASWMERLTLENPSHGIPVDVRPRAFDAVEPAENALAQTLRLEGKDVIAIDSDTDEAMRRTATLAAMRHGVNYIVNAQLAVGPLSDSVELLMRTPGFSELGNYLYIPCETEDSTIQHSAFRLCFLADLLHSLQGQLPPQVLVLRDDSSVLPLQCEDYIYHYRAVKQRFMAAQNAFRKHRMPDPLESAHFGRWSDCANELLKQRALGLAPEQEEEEEEIHQPEQVVQPVSAAVAGSSSQYDMDMVAAQSTLGDTTARPGTLVEQARMLEPDSSPDIVQGQSVDSLQNLEFIGSSQYPPRIGDSYSKQTAVDVTTFGEPPPPSLRNPANVDLDVLQNQVSSIEASSMTPFSNKLITSHDKPD
jgi:hypothetical protein